MKERVLRLSKRLSKFTLDEMLTITEDINESVLRLLLTTLVQEQKLIQRGDLYLYKKPAVKPKKQIFQMYDKSAVELIMKCFCSNIPSTIACNLVGFGDYTIARFYQVFREQIYLRQEAELKYKFNNDPQYSRNRMFFNQEVYLYTYNNIIYVSDKVLESSDNRFLTKEENKEFKKVYSYITRVLFHNKNEYYLFNKIAEAIWRRNKTFEELYSDLKMLLFS